MTGHDVKELVDGTRAFVRDHAERTAFKLGRAPGEASALAGALREGLDRTLRAELARARAARRVPALPPREDVRALVAALPDAPPEAVALANVEKRVDEVTGSLYALRQVLATEDARADVPAVGAAWARVDEGLARVERALDAWATAAAGTPGAPARVVGVTAVAVARRALDAGLVRPACAALRDGLAAAFTAKALGLGEAPAEPAPLDSALAVWDRRGVAPPIPVEDVRALDRALAGAEDALVAWRLLDVTEWLVNRVVMTPFPHG